MVSVSFKKRFFALALALCVLLTLSACGGETPSSAPSSSGQMFSDSDTDTEISEEATKVTLAGKTVTIAKAGEYVISESIADGQIIIDTDKDAEIQLHLDGVTIKSTTCAAIYVKSAGKVIITPKKGTENTLEVNGTFAQIDGNNVDGVIFSKTDLTINGEGKLNVSTAYGHGIVSKDNLVITGGNVNIEASKHGLSAKDSLRVSGGNYTINAGTDGINVENLEDATCGYFYAEGGKFNIACRGDGIDTSSSVTMGGGDFTISSEDDAIHATTDLKISGGKIDIKKSYEGLEGTTVEISGGEISLVSSDDGINAAGGNDESGHGHGDNFSSSDSFVKISGGKLTVDAGGDGIDSNGTVTVSGGETYISGPVSGANGALDFGISAEVSGGKFVAVGTTGMAQNFTTAKNQGAIKVNLSGAAGDKLTLCDETGKELFSCTLKKSFQSVVISTPDIQTDKTYILKTSTAETTVTMTELIYGASGGFGGPPGGLPSGRPGGMGGGGRPSMTR